MLLCGSLQSLEGLENLIYVYKLSIGSVPHLKNLDPLSGLATIESELRIGNNDSLVSISALTGVTPSNYIYIGNSQLQNLHGLDSIKDFDGTIVIQGNDSITSLAGLEGLESVSGGLGIINNGNLANLDVLQNLNYSSVPLMSISNNADPLSKLL